jgi:type IV secretory pathway VirB10-like protein
MSRLRSTTVFAALSLLTALTAAGCRQAEAPVEQAPATTAQEASRPPEGTTWPSDAPPAVTGASGYVGADANSDRERQLADREAAVAQREANVAKRESATSRPRTTTTTHRSTSRPTTTHRTAPAPVQRASRDIYEPTVDVRPAPAPPATRRQTVPAGTAIAATLNNDLSSATAQVGDGVTAHVTQDVYTGGVRAIPAGSRLLGEVVDAQGLRRVGGRARLGVRFTSVELPDGSRAPIDASWSAIGRNETGRDAATIGGSAAGGAVLGRVLSHGHRQDERTAQGAVVGAVIGTVIAARNQPSGELVLPAGTAVDLKLNSSTEVEVAR